MKWRFLLALTTLGSGFALATSEITGVVVEGDGAATTKFQCVRCENRGAILRIMGNSVELTWDNAVLSEKHQGKLEVREPHSLISRIAVFGSNSNSVKAVVSVRGAVDDLSKRVFINNGDSGATLQIAYPNGTSEALALLRHQEEAAPIQSQVEKKAAAPRMGAIQWVGILAVIILAVVTTIVGSRWIQRRSKLNGSRKFLIEKIAQVPIDAKASVVLLKVGSELVLIGVTAQSINFLSSLPRLQEEYDSESRLERQTFRDAVEEEFRRIKQKPSLAV